MRVAVVSPKFAPGSEEDLVTRRVSASLARSADVEMLVAGLGGSASAGAINIRAFPHLAPEPLKRDVLWRTFLGPSSSSSECMCLRRLVTDEVNLPTVVQEEIVRQEGGHSSELYEFIERSDYDVNLFAGWTSASTIWGLPQVPDGRRTVVLGLLSDRPVARLPILASALSQAHEIVVLTRTERDLVSELAPWASPDPVGFALRTNALSADTEPVGGEVEKYLLLVRDWSSETSVPFLQLAAALRADFPDLPLVLTGPGSERLPRLDWFEVRPAERRTDIWRWMSRAVALLEADRSFLGRNVIEAMTLGTPALVWSGSGAAKEHVEVGNGGLWFHDYSHLSKQVEALMNQSTRDSLGRQGQNYANAVFGDPEGFTARVNKAVMT